MPWTQADENRLQELRSQLDYIPPSPQAKPDSLLGYAGKTLANVPGGAVNEIVNTAQSLLGTEEQYRSPVPKVFDLSAPQGFGQQAVALTGGLAEMAPSFIVPELAVTKLGRAAGLTEKVASVLGQGAGFAAPFADQGAGQAVGQGAIGASQAAVRGAPLPIRIGAAIAGAAGGYALAPTPEEGKVAATFNAAVPLIIDPLLGKLAGHGVKQQTPKTPTDFSYQPGVGNAPHISGAGGGEMPPMMPPLEGQPIEVATLQTNGALPTPVSAPAPTIGGGQPIVGLPMPAPKGRASGYRPRRGEEHIPQGALMDVGAQTTVGQPETPYGSLTVSPAIEPIPIRRSLPETQPSAKSEMAFPDLATPQTPEGSLIQTPFTGAMDRPIPAIGATRPPVTETHLAPTGALIAQVDPNALAFKQPIRTGGTQIGDLLPSSQPAPRVHLGELQPAPSPLITGMETTSRGPIVSEEGFGSGSRPREEVATLQKPKGSRIEGPVLYDKTTGQILARGEIGKEHKDLYVEALTNQAEPNPDAIGHGFVDDAGNVHERKDAWRIAKEAGQIKPDVLSAVSSMGDDFAELHSDHLQEQTHVSPTSTADTAFEKLPKTVQRLLGETPEWKSAGEKGGAAFSTGAIGLREKIKPSHKAGIRKSIKEYRAQAAEQNRLAEAAGEDFVTLQKHIDEAQHLSAKAQFLNELVDTKLAVPKTEPVEPAASETQAPKGEVATVQVHNNRTGRWENASVLGRSDDGVLHVEIDDPIFGKREQYVNENGGAVRSGEEPMLASIELGTGPGPTGSKVRGAGKLALTIEEALAKLPKEAADIIAQVFEHWPKATGQVLDIHFSPEMTRAKAGAYIASGRIGFNLRWVNDTVKNWPSMSQSAREKAVMRITKTLGHEITHIVQQYGEKSGLAINGKPLLNAITDEVHSMTQAQRELVQREIAAKAGERSHVISKYLSGNVDYVRDYYESRFGRAIPADEAMQLAAGEFMAEIGSIELSKRTNLAGLPEPIRKAVNAFKDVIVRMVNWFRGNSVDFAPLQNLSDIANRMFDHFASADQAALGRAFPSSNIYKQGAIPHPFSSGTRTPPPKIAVTARSAEFLKEDLIRLGVRSASGAAIGGAFGPSLSDHQMTVGEGILLGGVLGLAGPAVAKKLLTTNVISEVTDAVKASKGNPLRAMRAMMQGKTPEQLAMIAARNPQTDSSIAHFMRWMEKEFNIHLDPITKGLFEHGKGLPQEQMAILGEAFNKAKSYTPNQALEEATLAYYEAKISKAEFLSHLHSPEEIAYGNFVTVAREAMTTLSQMFASGLPEGAFKKHVLKAADSYLGRHYSAFKEGKFNESAFIAARDDLMKRYPQFSAEFAENKMREYQAEILADRSMFNIKTRTGGSEQAIESKTLHHRLATEDEIAAQQIVVGGLEHDPFNPDYIKEKAKLNWMLTHTITDNWRQWLGEYTNPNERIMMSFMKTYPSAVSSKIISLFDSELAKTQEGLRYAYTHKEIEAESARIKNEITKGTATPEELVTLQKQQEQLQSYMPLSMNTAYGSLKGKWVHRLLRDELSTYDNGFKWMDQPILRGIAGFNNMIKVSRTALNPLTTIRNYFQLPIFSLISGAKMSDLGKTWNVLKNGTDPTLLSQMRQRHIIGADFVTSELSKGPGTYFSGYYDSDVAQRAARSGLDTMMRLYQVPDTLHRAMTFVNAREKFAARFIEENPGITMADALTNPSVLDKASAWTERYSMNYSAVPRIVKAARQLPFVSLFVSYTSEITRILYNLTQDVIKPHPDYASRTHAMTVLGAMTAIPAMLTVAAEEALSPKDREDWKSLQNLSPDYLRSRFRLPTGRDAEGRFTYIDVTNLLPADSYSQMVKAALSGDIQAAVAANPIASLQDTPLLNIASEQVTGRDRHTGQALEGVMDRSKQVLKEILPPIIPPGYEGQRLQRAFSENETGDLGTTNLRTGVQTKPSDIVLNYMTAMRFGNIMLEPIKRQAIAEAKDRIATLQTSARRILNTNVSQEEKQLAAEHFRSLSEEILKELTVRLQ